MSEEVQNENQIEKPNSKDAKTPVSKTVQVALRREKISELMLAGHDEGGIRRITEYLNKIGFDCKKSTVANDINFILAESAKKTAGNLEQRREMVNARLESLINVHWLDAQKGNVTKGYFVRTLLKDQRELYGLNAAQKLEHSNPDGSGLMEPVAAAVHQFNAAAIKIYGTGNNSGNDRS
jgi:hypothetical protein